VSSPRLVPGRAAARRVRPDPESPAPLAPGLVGVRWPVTAEARELLARRARSKLVSRPLAQELASLESPLHRAYNNSITCASRLLQAPNEDGTWTLTGRYCGNRWCLVCARARTAKAIARYKPTVEAWPGARLLTLTVPNVPGDALRPTMRAMTRAVRTAADHLRRYHHVRVIALRKLECTHNPERGDFHPHFHLIVEDEGAAARLLSEWLARHPHARRQAQDVRPIDRGALVEFFKYFTKLTAKSSRGTRAPMPPEALDTMFVAMRRLRVYQPMGFRPVTEDDEESELGTLATHGALPLPRPQVWEWDQDAADWLDSLTGEVLTGYEPGEAIRRYLQHYLGA
jgi:hypothetical protein